MRGGRGCAKPQRLLLSGRGFLLLTLPPKVRLGQAVCYLPRRERFSSLHRWISALQALSAAPGNPPPSPGGRKPPVCGAEERGGAVLPVWSGLSAARDARGIRYDGTVSFRSPREEGRAGLCGDGGHREKDFCHSSR